MSTREEFEKWARGSGYDITRSKFGGGFYLSMALECMWDAWQAATQAMKEKCSKLCDSYWDDLELLGEDEYQDGRGRAALDIRSDIDRIGDQS